MDSPLHRCRQIDDDDACFVGDAYALWGRVCKVHVTSKCYMFVERVIARLRVVVAVYLSLFFFFFFAQDNFFFFFVETSTWERGKHSMGIFCKGFFFMQFLCGFEFFFLYLCNRGGELAFEAPPLLGEQQLRTRFSIYRLKV